MTLPFESLTPILYGGSLDFSVWLISFQCHSKLLIWLMEGYKTIYDDLLETRLLKGTYCKFDASFELSTVQVDRENSNGVNSRSFDVFRVDPNAVIVDRLSFRFSSASSSSVLPTYLLHYTASYTASLHFLQRPLLRLRPPLATNFFGCFFVPGLVKLIVCFFF
jgi:hypothetical protein